MREIAPLVSAKGTPTHRLPHATRRNRHRQLPPPHTLSCSPNVLPTGIDNATSLPSGRTTFGDFDPPFVTLASSCTGALGAGRLWIGIAMRIGCLWTPLFGLTRNQRLKSRGNRLRNCTRSAITMASDGLSFELLPDQRRNGRGEIFAVGGRPGVVNGVNEPHRDHRAAWLDFDLFRLEACHACDRALELRLGGVAR